MYDELYHHGILGQRWGIRRYQNENGSYKHGAEGRYYNYDPIGRHKAAKEEKKKQSTSSEENTSSSKKRYKISINKNSNNQTSENANETSTEKKGLTDKQKKAIAIGAAAVAASLAAGAVGYGVYRYQKKKKAKENGEFLFDGEENRLKSYGVNPISEGDVGLDDAIYWSNKNAMGWTYGRNHNCISSAFASELRLRGYDVCAKEQVGSYSPTDLMKVFGKPERLRDLDTQEDLISALESQGEGARGILMGSFHNKSEGAHFFNYIIENGKAVFFDGQRGEIERDLSYWTYFGNDCGVYDLSKVMFFRTDDKTFDADKIMNYVEPNDGGHFAFTRNTEQKWREEGPPKSAVAYELVNGEYRKAIRRGYRYVKGAT